MKNEFHSVMCIARNQIERHYNARSSQLMREFQFDKAMCIAKTHQSLSSDCQMKIQFQSVISIHGNRCIELSQLMKEFQLDKVMCIQQIYQSLSNDCQMKNEFHSVMCIQGNQIPTHYNARSSQLMKEFQFDKAMCIAKTHQSLSSDCQMKIQFQSVIGIYRNRYRE
jgi:formyltetrahydrofolate synthetase